MKIGATVAVAALAMAFTAAAQPAPPALQISRPREPVEDLGPCLWDGLTAADHAAVLAALQAGRSTGQLTGVIEARPGFSGLLARCDPTSASHANLAKGVFTLYAIEALTLDYLNAQGFTRDRLLGELSPDDWAAIRGWTVAIGAGSGPPPQIDWGPVLSRLGVERSDPKAWYIYNYYMAAAMRSYMLHGWPGSADAP